MKRLLPLLAILLAVPVLGWVVSTAIIAHVESTLPTGGRPITVAEVCNNLWLRSDRKIVGFCNEIENLQLMTDASVGVAAAVIALPLLYWLASLIIGSSRVGLAWIFPVIVRLSLVALAGIVLVQAMILVGAVFNAEAYLVGRVHGGLLLMIGIGALIVTLRLIFSAFTLGRRKKTYVEGQLVEKDAHPKVHKIVDIVAKRLDARPPDNIVMGLDPTFFVTSAKVHLVGHSKPLSGETLFISLPLVRLLTVEEFAAVIGHELGHFRGKDTAYSLKFAPVYAGLAGALENTANAAGRAEQQDVSGLMALPAVVLLSFMLHVFSRNESAISRKREFAADKAATEVAPASALASALLKTSILVPFWPSLLRASSHRVAKGDVFLNLSAAFEDCSRFDVDPEKAAGCLDELLKTRIAHPTDSHPPVGERIRALGLQASAGILNTVLQFPAQPASLSFGNIDELERDLTLRRHKALVASGVYQLPEEKELTEDEKFNAALANCCYSLAAAIVKCDGGLSPARALAADTVPVLADYDRFTFREVCRYPNEWIAPTEAADVLRALLNDAGRRTVLTWLHSILTADHDRSEDSTNCFRWIEQKLIGE
jgi:Zn-dependent protease with chaperone function